MRAMTGVVLALAMASASGAAMAQTLAWQITEMSGAVTIRHGAEEHAAVRGAMLQPGDAISTGVGARAVMVHEKDFVTLAGRSRATVPGMTEQASGFTKLLQDLGNAVYKIEKRGVPHFGVTTPYLAAVVKGTTFSITVDDRGSTLQVVEGAVEVATPDGGARDLILPAGVASVSAADRLRLTVHGDSERIIDSPARVTTGAATGGADAAGDAAPARPTAAAAPTTQANAAPEPRHDVILVPVASRPVDMAAFTGGLVTGTAGFTALTSSTTQAVRIASANVAAALPLPLAATPAVADVAPVAAAPVIAATTPATAAAAAPVVAAVTNPAVAAIAIAATVAPAVTPVPVLTVATPVATPTATPAITTPAAPVTTPVIAPPVVTPVATPAVTTPVVTPVMTPVVTTPVVTPVMTPVVTTPVVTPVVATPAVNPVATPAVTTPVVTPVTTPVVITPVTTPVVTAPVVTPVVPAIKGGADDDGESGKIKSDNGDHHGGSKGKD